MPVKKINHILLFLALPKELYKYTVNNIFHITASLIRFSSQLMPLVYIETIEMHIAEVQKNQEQPSQWKTCSLCNKEAFCSPSTSVTMAWIKAGLGQQKCTWRCETCQPTARLMN